jgi:hypothetical protein
MTYPWYAVYCMTLPNGVLKLQAEEEARCEVLDVVHAHHVVRSSAHHKGFNQKIFTCKTRAHSPHSTAKMWVFYTRDRSHEESKSIGKPLSVVLQKCGSSTPETEVMKNLNP